MDADDFQSEKLDPRTPRRSYLVTYSQADLVRFPTRKHFGKIIKASFNAGSAKVKVSQWACCLEDHENNGKHYHVAIKLSGVKRWKKVKDELVKNHGIVVNFSDKHDNYYSAYKYICKSDHTIQTYIGIISSIASILPHHMETSTNRK